MNDCVFCKIAAGEVPALKLFEDKDTLAFLDIGPVNPGHALVIPKKHFRNLFDTPDDILSELMPKIKRIATGVMEGSGAKGVVVSMNNEPTAGQIVFHAHFHIIPRFEGDGLRPWERKGVSAKEMERLARDIARRI